MNATEHNTMATERYEKSTENILKNEYQRTVMYFHTSRLKCYGYLILRQGYLVGTCEKDHML